MGHKKESIYSYNYFRIGGVDRYDSWYSKCGKWT